MRPTTYAEYEEVRGKLIAHGWIPASAGPSVSLETAIRQYQAFHGLAVDGWAGPITQRHLAMPRFCACPDRMTAGNGAKWDHLDVSYFVRDPLPRWTLEETWRAADWAFAQWAAITALKPRRSETRNEADILITVGPIDGAGKVLAWSNLPPARPVMQRYDSRESGWILSATPGAYIDAGAVIAHEVGHALGLEHDARSGQLMSPTYEPGLRVPQANDKARIVELYGANTNPPPVKVKLDRLVVSVDGQTFVAQGEMKPV